MDYISRIFGLDNTVPEAPAVEDLVGSLASLAIDACLQVFAWCMAQTISIICWLPFLLIETARLWWYFVCDWASNFACDRMPQEWWREGHFASLECERRLYPWTHFFRSWKNYLVKVIVDEVWANVYIVLQSDAFMYAYICVMTGIVGTIAYGLWQVPCSLEKFPEEKRYRFWRALFAWVRSEKVEVTLFRPHAICGTRPGLEWTTTSAGLRRTDTTDVTTQPLPPANGTYLIACLPFEMQTHRRGLYVRYVLRPSWWATQTLPDDVVVEKYCLRKERIEDKLMIQVAELGSHTSAEIDVVTWDTIMNSLRSSGKTTQPYSVGTTVARYATNLPRDQLTTIQSAVTAFWNKSLDSKLLSVQSTVRQALQFVGDKRDQILAPWKSCGRRVMPAFVSNEDSMPVSGYQSGLAAVNYRLDGKRNNMRITEDVAKAYCESFVQLVLKDATVIQPWSLEQMLEHQNGPIQRIRNEVAKWVMNSMDKVSVCVKAMIKKEAIQNQGPVRNISTVEPEHNLSLGRYMMAAAEFLKQNTVWYTAGKTPKETAKRIVELTEAAPVRDNGFRWVCCADVSKMDAAKNGVLTAWLTTKLYVKLFGVEETELQQLRKNEVASEARTAEGEQYQVGGSQLSGSACTTIDNTVTNAFISFVAYRLQGLEPEEAYANLGAYVGDDSVSYNTEESVEAAGRALGYVIKAEIVNEGEDVPFLSRYFYECWTGGDASVQDPVRLMRKIALSIAPEEVSPQQAAVDKARGYSELDSSCSFYAALHDNLQRITGLRAENRYDESYMQRQVREGGGWPTNSAADETWEKYTNVSVARLVSWVDSLETWNEFMKGPPCIIENAAPPKVELTVDPTTPEAVVPEEVQEEGEPPQTATVAVGDMVTQAMLECKEMVKTGLKEITKMVTEERRNQAKAPPKAPKAPKTPPVQGPMTAHEVARTRPKPVIGVWSGNHQ